MLVYQRVCSMILDDVGSFFRNLSSDASHSEWSPVPSHLWAVGQNHRLSNYASISARNEEIASQPVHLEFAAFTSPKMGTTKPQFSIVGDKSAMVNGYTIFMSFTRDDASQKHTLHPVLLTWWQKWVGFPSIFWE